MRAHRTAVLFLAVLVTSVAACAGDDAPDAQGPADAASRPAREPSEPPQAEAVITPERRPLTIAFAGDIHFEGELRPLLDDPAGALSSIAPELSAADLTIVNLESSIGPGGQPEPKRFTFQAPPDALTALAAAGVDVVSLANNHAADFGLGGLESSLAAAQDARNADPPLEVVGIGRNADQALTPAKFDVDSTTVAVFAASAADDDPTADPTGQWSATPERAGTADALDPSALGDAVAADTSDVVVVYLHWGVQGESCPSLEQEELASTLADAGADIIVGSHAHRLQGSGVVDGAYVAYGLGNFVWYTQASDATTTTGVLTLTVDPDAGVTDEQWTPARIGGDGIPAFVSGETADEMRASFAELRDCTNLAGLR
jgi:poly-gamma-glutamate capsule biosynthesis protein CapA/YwtB (metallophosphatase superfamily)